MRLLLVEDDTMIGEVVLDLLRAIALPIERGNDRIFIPKRLG
jgi:hypothetical protein